MTKERLASTLGEDILSIVPFTQGQIGEIFSIYTADKTYILKTSEPSDRLQIEASMLEDINKYDIPVPEVFSVGESHLLMKYIDEKNISVKEQEISAAKVLADLHSVSNEGRMYGYYYNTSIGPFTQINEQTQYNWGLFLGQMRIMPMAKICYDKGAITKDTVQRLERLCRDLYKRIDMNQITPSLIHGDLWGGNILFNDDSAVLIDPAIYFSDREMELAFILMFNTFGTTFFEKYNAVHPLSEDFYTVKVPLYQIYPTLVHVALYGAAYTGKLETLLKRMQV
jgi:fructosamine-3-kinase